MKHINDIISALMVLIPIGAVPRAIYCLGQIIIDSDQEHSYRTRIKNLFLFVAIAECALTVILLVRSYF